MAHSEASEDTQISERPRRPVLRAIAVVIVLVALVFAGLQAIHKLPHWLNPFGETTKDRSAPVVLNSIQNLS
jgi:disulfide bond formation protein DsbB